jgi:hypothetical protein
LAEDVLRTAVGERRRYVRQPELLLRLHTSPFQCVLVPNVWAVLRPLPGHILEVLDIGEKDFVIETSFLLTPLNQFDQAGLIVHCNSECWVKTGLEYVDGKARLSCVVTNHGYSDWSTQPWPTFELRIRVYKLKHKCVSASGEAAVSFHQDGYVCPPQFRCGVLPASGSHVEFHEDLPASSRTW